VAAGVVIAVLVVARFWPAPVERHISTVQPPGRPSVVEMNTARMTNLQPSTTMRPRSRRPGATDSARLPSSPQVLVPARQREAVGRLFDSLRAGRPEVVSMLLSIQGAEGRAEPGDLSVAPLRIEPVVISTLPTASLILDK
jgi:hypothetical protein